MNEHALRVLEYDRFLDLLVPYARTEPGRDRVRSLRPCGEDEVAEPRRLYADGLRIRRAGQDLPPVQFASPAEALRRAAPEGATLDPDAFAVLRGVLRAAATLCAFAARPECAGTALRELVGGVQPHTDLLKRIEATFDDETGHVASRASDRLRGVRARITAMEKSIRGRLEKLVQALDLADAFQDDFVTVRHGRYVVPVRRESRARIPGIVHDQSHSGSTLFVEPEALVEAGNELECLRLDEQDEVRRILSAMTAGVRERREDIAAAFDALCRYDAAFAVSAWAADYQCAMPRTGDCLRLSAARHPLLEHRLRHAGRPDALVPLDIEAAPDRNVVAITGSNTGGKTVALKTIGLLVCVAQSGLPIPAAPETCLPFFEDILADIGDEQSIEQNLSTFSAHLENIVRTLAGARARRSLVLLDELGAGTDPVEGGALGCAILDALSRTAGLTFATTHLGAVKRFVHAHPRMLNAAMLFDTQTLRPQYRLIVGRAGASYALTIAERCGLPPEVISSARGLLDEEDVRLEAMLSSLDQQQVTMDHERRTLEQVRGEADQAQRDAREARDRANQERQDLRKRRGDLLHQAHDEASALVTDARREIEQVLTQARTADKNLARELRQRLDLRNQILREGLRRAEENPEAPPDPAELKAGMRVWVESLRDHAIVAALSDNRERVTVENGGLRIELRRDQLGRARAPTASTAPRAPRATPAPARRESPGELILVGQRVAEALSLLDRFLDLSLLAGLDEVRIVHGFGTGTLQKAVHERLDALRIRSYRLGVTGEDPGGAGVTIVSLRGE